MWTSRIETIAPAVGQRYVVEFASKPAAYAEVLTAWREDPAFAVWIGELLAASPYAAFRWETPPVTSATLGRAFEFVLLDSPGLAAHPDPHAFAEHFPHDPTPVVTFANLGRDAVLVVPCPLGDPAAYRHLAAFVRTAPRAQVAALWPAVAEAMQQRVGRTPVWLSTAGAGVSWLHVRLDDRPKYYGHAPYRAG